MEDNWDFGGWIIGIILVVVFISIILSQAMGPPIPYDAYDNDDNNDNDGPFVGSVNSNIYHYPWCEWAQRINPANEIWFDSAVDARAHGYRPCHVCYPPDATLSGTYNCTEVDWFGTLLEAPVERYEIEGLVMV